MLLVLFWLLKPTSIIPLSLYLFHQSTLWPGVKLLNKYNSQIPCNIVVGMIYCKGNHQDSFTLDISAYLNILQCFF